MRRRLIGSFVVAVAVLVVPVAGAAHGNTQFAGVLHGSLRPSSPILQFEGDAAFAGRFENVPSSAQYHCTASGPNGSTVPFGGPFEGTFTCTASSTSGAAPAVATGTLEGWVNVVTIAMRGVFNPGGHRFNCEGLLRVEGGNPTTLSAVYGVSMACLIE